MSGNLTNFTAAELLTVVLAAVLVVLLAIIGYRAWLRSRVTPEERERRRCEHLVAVGKINDAMLVEIRENLVFYSYAVRGVEYTASQDLSLLGRAPVDLTSVHSLSVKYDPRNPANSIIMSEEWSGLLTGHLSEPRP
jgi:hypothetical protein